MTQYPAYETQHFLNANDLWDALSPTRDLFKNPCKPVYRGQADSEWKLLPSVLRSSYVQSIKNLFRNTEMSIDSQIFHEMSLLIRFTEFCDQIGLRIPNDSIDFRANHLNTDKLDEYITSPQNWPNPKILEVMSMAQHHGIPTRLIDWSKSPYVAAYFAASTALQQLIDPDQNFESKKIAIWCLNLEYINLYEKVKPLHVCGATSPNLSAQSGLFIIHPVHETTRHQPIVTKGLESEFSNIPKTPLLKLTLDVEHVASLLALCMKVGLSAATIYPNANGAAKAVRDQMNLSSYLRKQELIKSEDAPHIPD